MRITTRIFLFACVVGFMSQGAAAMTNIVVTNKSDSLVQITPIDDAHPAPAPLGQVSSTLPPGAFILTNQTAAPIHAVVVLWSYMDKSGHSQPRTMNCDGYLNGQVEPIVRAQDSVLITPGGCLMREYFDARAAGKPMFGDNLYFSRNQSVNDLRETLDTVRITIDSVIFADGRIWGPDTRHYYKEISERYWAVRSVVDEVTTARAAGEDMKTRLQKILADAAQKRDRASTIRLWHARTIYESPNPEATLKYYVDQTPLPEFQHIGGSTR